MDETARGAGWLLFAGIMLIVAGTLNIIWGIAAVDNANFVEGERYIFEDPQHHGLDRAGHRRDPGARCVLDLGWRGVRPLDRDPRRLSQRHRRAALDPRLPAVVRVSS